jgi:hypothetical protein
MAVSVENYFNHNYPSFSKMPSLFRQGVISLFKKIFHEDEINDFDYLWQGIGAYLIINQDIKYMFGFVSISNPYSL